MRKILLFILVVFFTSTAFVGGWYFRDYLKPRTNVMSNDKAKEPEKPLETYTIENLANNNYESGKIAIKETLEKEDSFTSYLFNFKFKPNPDKQVVKTTTGMINLPNKSGKYPIIVMLRGYVDVNIYQTGIGTKNASYFFADNNFITVAPDFLGYAQSDKEAEDIFETRFQTYTTTLSLLNSLEQIDKWDGDNIFIWAHSNGGQIALTTLEISKKKIPTVLWAPVSKPFPYSILYYTDESEDGGKYIRSELANFEKLYDADAYSLINYLNLIDAPIQIHQGTADDAVPEEWSKELVDKLKVQENDIEYFVYPNANHNLQPGWNTAVERSLKFYQSYLNR